MNKLLSLVLVFMLSGCITGTSQPAKFYTLRSADSNTGYINNKIKLSLGVNTITIPDYLDKPQIVTLKDNSVEMNISEMNRWSEPLSTMMQRTLADDLSVALPNAVIKAKNSARENFDYTLQVEINKFEGSWDKEAVLSAWWTLTNKDNKVIFREKADLTTPMSDSYDDLVIKESNLIAQLAQQIAQKLSKLN